MAIFKYKSINEKGCVVSGRIDAVNEPDLESRLNNMGLDLVKCKEITNDNSFSFSNRKISRQEIINFCFHMEQMTRAGVPILESLVDLRDSLENPRFRETISAIIASIEGGKTFSEALRDFPSIFDQVFVSLIEAGEHSGELALVLQKMTDSLKWQDEIIEKTKKVMLYPCVVGTVIISVLFFLMIYLVPELVNFIQNMGGELPVHTRILISTSNFFINYWYLILSIPLFSFFMLKIIAKKNEKVQLRIDKFKLNAFIFGPIINKLILARFATYFALLYRSGITVLNCLKISEHIAGNLAIRNALRDVGRFTSDGDTLTQSVQKVDIFPPLVVRMLKVGENTGRLDEALDNVGYFYNREVNDSIERMQTHMQVSMTVVLGSIIAWVMLSVLGPVYDIISTI